MLVVAIGIAVQLRVDADLWGHLRFGLDSLESGLRSDDPYSFTQDVPWINHEWLSELLTALAYRSAGVIGLSILKCLVLGAALATTLGWTNGARPELRGWLAVAAFLGLYPAAVTLRPQLWTILGVALLCAILAGRLRLLWMPLLFAAWANLHGGWIVGAGISALWIAGRLLDSRSVRAVVAPALALAVSLAFTLANPYGWELWRFLLTTVRMSRPDISEWAPYWAAATSPWDLLLLPLLAAILVATLALRWRATPWARLLPALWLIASSVWVARLAPFAGMLVLFLAADAWRADPGAEGDDGQAAPDRVRKRRIEVAVLVAIHLPILFFQYRCLPIAGPWAPDLVAAGALDEPSLRGKLLLPFNWGEYAIWHWGPSLQVSIDGRRETVYSQSTIDRQLAIMRGAPEALESLKQMRPEYAWAPGAPEESPLGQWLLGNGYRVDVRTEQSFVATRSDLPVLEPRPPMPACFP